MSSRTDFSCPLAFPSGCTWRCFRKYLFILSAALCHGCRVWALSRCGGRERLCGGGSGFSSWGDRAQLPCGVFPGPGMELKGETDRAGAVSGQAVSIRLRTRSPSQCTLSFEPAVCRSGIPMGNQSPREKSLRTCTWTPRHLREYANYLCNKTKS